MSPARVRRAALWMLASCGVGLATLAALDWALRLTPWHADFGVAPLPALSGYYRPDPALGFDIQEDFPTTRVAVRGDGVIYTIWSNALGCFDRPYRDEPGYVLLVGDSFSHAYAPFDASGGRGSRPCSAGACSSAGSPGSGLARKSARRGGSSGARAARRR